MFVSVLHHLWGEVSKSFGLLFTTNAMLRAPLAISLGAISGALSRYYLTLAFTRWLGSSFPYGTFVINLTGAMLMGFFVTVMLDRAITSPDLRLLVTTGFLGSYTTFATYELATFALLQVGNKGGALLYWLGSAMLGFAGLELGSVLARRLP